MNFKRIYRSLKYRLHCPTHHLTLKQSLKFKRWPKFAKKNNTISDIERSSIILYFYMQHVALSFEFSQIFDRQCSKIAQRNRNQYGKFALNIQTIAKKPAHYTTRWISVFFSVNNPEIISISCVSKMNRFIIRI